MQVLNNKNPCSLFIEGEKMLRCIKSELNEKQSSFLLQIKRHKKCYAVYKRSVIGGGNLLCIESTKSTKETRTEKISLTIF
jgi:hypothetical protein